MTTGGAGGQDRERRGRGTGGGGRGTSDRRGPVGAGARRDAGVTRRTPRPPEPALPDDVTGRELDRSVRAELGSLAKLNADAVARHLVMAGRLLDEDPDQAYLHAMAAQRRAARVGSVREAAGLAAYATGRYAEALAELRAARRITGDLSNLPVMADCERGLGRPERALALAAGPEVAGLDTASRVELAIVASGARRDLGQPEAAVVALQRLQLRPGDRRPWSARLFYAYAEALLDSGRRDEATTWFEHAAAADTEGHTDAAERHGQLTGVTFLAGDEAWDGSEDAERGDGRPGPPAS